MAAPTFGSIGTGISTSTSTPQFSVPSGVAANSMIIIPVFLDGVESITGLPSGFSNAENSPVELTVEGGGDHKLYVFWKRATGADTGTYDFTVTGSSYIEGAALRYENVVTTGTPFDAGTDSAFDTASGTDTPAVTTSSLGADRMFIHAATNWAGSTWTPPSGYTKRLDLSGGVGFGIVYESEKSQAAASSSGSIVAEERIVTSAQPG